MAFNAFSRFRTRPSQPARYAGSPRAPQGFNGMRTPSNPIASLGQPNGATQQVQQLTQGSNATRFAPGSSAAILRGPNPPQRNGGLLGNLDFGSGQSQPGNPINIGSTGAGLLRGAAALAPGWAGVGLGAVQAGLRANNVAVADSLRPGLGADPLRIGQIIGGVTGLNGYGSLGGNQTLARNDPGQSPVTSLGGAPVAVTQGGMYDQGFMGGGPFGVFSDMRRAYTPGEQVNHGVLQRAYAANPGRFGNGNAGFGGSAPSGGLLGRPGTAGRFGPAIVSGHDQPRSGATPAYSRGRPVMGMIQHGNGGASEGIVGYRQADGRITDRNGNRIRNRNGVSRARFYNGPPNAGNNFGNSRNTNGPGQASNATGQIGERGIGAGTY